MEIVDNSGAANLTLSIGIVSRLFSLENLPGRSNESYAFCPGDGLLFRGNEAGSAFGPRADVGSGSKGKYKKVICIHSTRRRSGYHICCAENTCDFVANMLNRIC